MNLFRNILFQLGLHQFLEGFKGHNNSKQANFNLGIAVGLVCNSVRYIYFAYTAQPFLFRTDL